MFLPILIKLNKMIIIVQTMRILSEIILSEKAYKNNKGKNKNPIIILDI